MQIPELQTDRTFLNKILEVNDFTKMNMMEVINFIYDATYLKYRQKFLQEKLHREEMEKRIVGKNAEIDRLTKQLSTMEEALEAAGIDLPKESKEEA